MNLLHEFRDVSAGCLRVVRRRQVGSPAPARVRRLRQAGQAPGDAGRGAAGPRRVAGEPPAGLSSSTSTRSARAASTGAGCGRTRSSSQRRGTRLHARGRPPRHGGDASTTSTARRLRDITAWDDTKAMMVKAQIVPAVLHAARGRRGRGRRAAAHLGGAPGERAARRSRHARVRRSAAGAARGRQVVAVRARRPAVVPRVRAVARDPGKQRHAGRRRSSRSSASSGS